MSATKDDRATMNRIVNVLYHHGHRVDGSSGARRAVRRAASEYTAIFVDDVLLEGAPDSKRGTESPIGPAAETTRSVQGRSTSAWRRPVICCLREINVRLVLEEQNVSNALRPNP